MHYDLQLSGAQFNFCIRRPVYYGRESDYDQTFSSPHWRKLGLEVLRQWKDTQYVAFWSSGHNQLTKDNSDLSGKLQGNGFRGKASTTIFSQLSELYGGEVLSNDQETNAVITSNVDTIVSALGNIISRIVGSSTESITMLENIPQRERAMDGVQAQIVRENYTLLFIPS